MCAWLEAGEDTLAALELLGEELLQLVEHFEQVSCSWPGYHELQLIPAQVSVHENHGRSATQYVKRVSSNNNAQKKGIYNTVVPRLTSDPANEFFG